MTREAHPQILILFAHPALEKSRVNSRLAAAVKDLAGVTFNDLYEQYPEFDVDVGREQELLTGADLVILQHPFFWYSTPALLKQWEDLVLEHGWAYGSEATALRGKRILSAITAGGREEAYQREGHNRFTMAELLRPIEQTARLCGMDWLPPFAVHGTHRMSVEQMERHAADYRRAVEALRDGRLDLAAARERSRLNDDLDALIRDGDRAD
ncbi:MAG: NAD(P)H oxidoreductase [Acidobacteria bacterium]|nr:MAG: NAD(P)H oxidoreductase [Acidobacteriota bacterium]